MSGPRTTHAPRVLCAADLHIGAGQDHRVDALADQEAVLDQIVHLARDTDTELLLLAGDVFHRPKPTPAELHVFARFARQLERASIPTIAVLGNAGHDQLGTDLPSALELFGHGDWLRVSRTPELIRAAGDVAVCTLPSVPVARLVAQRGGGDRAEVNELAAMLLLEAARELRDQVPNGWPSVLLLHWSVSGAALPTGLPVADLHEPVLPADALAELDFDYIVGGHIHAPQFFIDGTGFYCGPPMAHSFGEPGDHGVWVLDGDAPEFVPLVDRRFVTVAVDLTDIQAWPPGPLEGQATPTPVAGYDGAAASAPSPEAAPPFVDETDVIAASIMAAAPLEDAVVRVSYRATEEQHRRVDHVALAGFLDEAGVHKLYGGIQWEPVRESRARVAGVDEQLDPLAALDAWCKANSVDDAPTLALGRLTRDYLQATA